MLDCRLNFLKQCVTGHFCRFCDSTIAPSLGQTEVINIALIMNDYMVPDSISKTDLITSVYKFGFISCIFFLNWTFN